MSKSELEYSIEKSDTLYELINIINTEIGMGWIPLGGVAIAWSRDGLACLHYCQAMTRIVNGIPIHTHDMAGVSHDQRIW